MFNKKYLNFCNKMSLEIIFSHALLLQNTQIERYSIITIKKDYIVVLIINAKPFQNKNSKSTIILIIKYV